ncbi:MAG: DUF1631 family protein [Burkholderiales bacterium]
METSTLLSPRGTEPSPLRMRALLGQCREIVRERMNRIIAEALEKLELDLVRLADSATARSEQQVLSEAVAHLRKHRGEIAVAFDRNFLEVFDRRLDRPGTEKVAQSVALRIEDLALVADNAIEDEIIVSQLAKKTKDRIDPDELMGVRARIGHLLANEELKDEANPIAPEAIIEALKRACDHIPAEHAVKAALLQAFQPYVAGAINPIYADVNHCLIANHVLPRIRHAVRRTSDHALSGGHRTLASAPGLAPGVVALTQPMRLDQLLSATQRMSTNGLAAFGGFPGSGPHGSGGGYSGGPGGGIGGGGGAFGSGPDGHGAPGGLNASQPMPVTAPTQAELSSMLASVLAGPPEARAHVARMLAEPARYAFEPVMALPASPSLITSLSALQTSPEFVSSLAQGGINFLTALDNETRAQVHPLDELTIELVTVVFDYILNDEALPATIKAEISRLQIVSVKAAILDRSFFARRQHPMRQLLDRIAKAGSDPVVDTRADSTLVTGLRAIVDEVVAEFTDDLAQFTVAIEHLEKLLADEATTREGELAKTARRLEQQEQAEIGHASALAEVRRRIRRKTPDYIRDFLLEWWTKVLVDAYLAELQGDDSWTHRLGVADALIWSVGPLRRNEVAQLAAMLPTLMKSLSRGMSAVDMPAETRHAFFNQLMQTHTAGVNAAKAQPAAGEATLPEMQPAANDNVTGPLAEQETSRPSDSGAISADYYVHAVRALERGAVIEFVERGEKVRSKLSWISPRQTIYLFTSAGGGARSLAPDALAQSLRSGAARMVDDSAALMDRVVEAVVGAPPISD